MRPKLRFCLESSLMYYYNPLGLSDKLDRVSDFGIGLLGKVRGYAMVSASQRPQAPSSTLLRRGLADEIGRMLQNDYEFAPSLPPSKFCGLHGSVPHQQTPTGGTVLGITL